MPRAPKVERTEQKMTLRDRIYWFFCSKEKREAILGLRKQFEQEFEGQVTGMLSGIKQDVEKKG